MEDTIKISYKSNRALLNGSEFVTLPFGMHEVMPWIQFNATEAEPGGDMVYAYHRYIYIYI